MFNNNFGIEIEFTGITRAQAARIAAEHFGTTPYGESAKDSRGRSIRNFVNICSRVAAEGLSVSSFVGDMSTGYSGNLGYRIPSDWAFDQFANIRLSNSDPLNYVTIEIDKNAISGRYEGKNTVDEYVEQPGDVGAPYTAPPPITKEGNQSAADTGLWVNMGNDALPVYGSISNSPYAHPADQIGEIAPFEFFSMIDVQKANVWTIHWCVVWFRNAAGVMERGYVDTGTNAEDPEEYRTHALAQFNALSWFGNLRVGDPNAATPLRWASADDKRGTNNSKRIFSLTTNAHIFDASGNLVGELQAGDQVTIDEKPYIGGSRPWNVIIYEKKIGDGSWQTAVPGNDYGWIDTRIPYGVTPSKRLLV